MVINEKEALNNFYSGHRVWQGIPSIERTEKGRMFCVFYSGSVKEAWGNFVVLLKSDDNGKTWGEPAACAYAGEHARCFDSCLWIDPEGRLWWFWSVMPVNSVWCSVCEDPDADELVWSPERIVGGEVMMNRPTLASDGKWLLPLAVWRDGVRDRDTPVTFSDEKLAYTYVSEDSGRTFVRLGGANVPERSFDEHMLLEKQDGTLECYVRTDYGIGKSVSNDGGQTWSDGCDSGLPGPCSRFHIRRLNSGNILFVSHIKYPGEPYRRAGLSAWLSEDDGATWKGPLMLDEREEVSYPDAVERGGYIWIIYDRERGGFKASQAEAEACAREILFAKITEAEILSGKCPPEDLKNLISKLGHSSDDFGPLYGDRGSWYI